MSYLDAIILGLLQGLTEFLPVSSSGHLAILQNFFAISGDKVVVFTVLLHVGTLISVVYMYWQDIWELIKELILTIKDLFTGKGLRLQERPVRKLGVMMIVATIPTGIIGLLFNDMFTKFYNSLVAIALGLIFTGIILWISENLKSGHTKIEGMNFRNAIFIGVLQGIAICPGISRSGSTLVGGLTTGLDRDFAVKFAFLISIPSIVGSLIFEGGTDTMGTVLSTSIGPIIVGMICAALAGIFAIKAMITVVRKYTLKYFSIYVWIVAAGLLTYSIAA